MATSWAEEQFAEVIGQWATDFSSGALGNAIGDAITATIHEAARRASGHEPLCERFCAQCAAARRVLEMLEQPTKGDER